MSFTEIIQQNTFTALLFWFVFCLSILISKLYQDINIKFNSNPRNKFRRFEYLEKNIWIVAIIILPSLLVGFRGVEVGADTWNNVNGYLSLSVSQTQVIIWDRLFFSLFRYFIYIISNGNETFFLFSMAFVTLFILVKALDKWIEKISLPMSLFVYYALFGMQLLNQSRQLIAMSIFLYAIPFLIERKYLKYLFIILIASLFHFTAVLGIPFSFIYFKKSYYAPIKKFFFYLCWFFSPILIYPLFMLIIRIVPSTYHRYLEVLSFDGLGLGVFIAVFPVLIPIILYRKYIVNWIDKYFARISLLVYPFRFAGYYSYYLMRLSYFSSIFMILLVPIIISNMDSSIKKSRTRISICIIFIVYYVIHYMYVDAADMFPYYSVLSR